MTWTDDRIETLKHYWQDGFSASQIAQRLGEVTRNAVIGKVHRLGLAGRGNSSRRALNPAKPAASRPAQRTPARRLSPGRAFALCSRSHLRPCRAYARSCRNSAPAPPSPVTVQTLTSLICRWPEGDPKAPDFHFCGRTKTNPKPSPIATTTPQSPSADVPTPLTPKPKAPTMTPPFLRRRHLPRACQSKHQGEQYIGRRSSTSCFA